MSQATNLVQKIKSQLPTVLVELVETAGRMAAGSGQRLYIVGGVVRDIILGQTNLDLDLVVEGDALALARQLAPVFQAELVTHPRFRTARIHRDHWRADLAMARAETYVRPGALPRVKPGTLRDDLFRRDFTINTLAIQLHPDSYGQLIDWHGGVNDLEQRLIRVLYPHSFVDDATRIWRGLRYQQRLGFQIETDTLRLLRRDVPMLTTISGDRLRRELELVFREAQPEAVIYRAGELGVLQQIHPALTVGKEQLAWFERARQLSAFSQPAVTSYWALLGYRLTSEQIEEIATRLRLPKAITRVVRETAIIREQLPWLDVAEMAPSAIYNLLNGYTPAAITANYLAAESPLIRQHIDNYLHRLCYVRTVLSSQALKLMGVRPGAQFGKVLKWLHDARLDGRVSTKQEEEALVKQWLVGDTRAD